MTRYRIGCAGWSYRDWLGKLYPPRLAPGRWLEHYAQLFPIVEIDSTFYGLPGEATVQGWLKRVESHADFAFAAKLPQDATHRALPKGNLEDAIRVSQEFLERVVRPLEEQQRLSAVLVQLPPSFEAFGAGTGLESVPLLLGLLSSLEPKKRRVAVEFRHGSWYEHVGERLVAEVAEALGSLGVCAAQVDGLGSRFHGSRTTSWSYFRLHGRRTQIPPSERHLSHAPYNYLYSRDEILELKSGIERFAEEDERSIVIFNNHYKAQAAVNAMDLMEAMGLGRPRPHVPNQRESRLEEFGSGRPM